MRHSQTEVSSSNPRCRVVHFSEDITLKWCYGPISTTSGYLRIHHKKSGNVEQRIKRNERNVLEKNMVAAVNAYGKSTFWHTIILQRSPPSPDRNKARAEIRHAPVSFCFESITEAVFIESQRMFASFSDDFVDFNTNIADTNYEKYFPQEEIDSSRPCPSFGNLFSITTIKTDPMPRCKSNVDTFKCIILYTGEKQMNIQLSVTVSSETSTQAIGIDTRRPKMSKKRIGTKEILKILSDLKVCKPNVETKWMWWCDDPLKVNVDHHAFKSDESCINKNLRDKKPVSVSFNSGQLLQLGAQLGNKRRPKTKVLHCTKLEALADLSKIGGLRWTPFCWIT
ncbi:hypothetical protein GQR58_014745 [Nymphon striatum]|nr:hypothetical protein GQR58_014745 [Nymphon striatum]